MTEYKLADIGIRYNGEEMSYRDYLYEISFDSEDAYELCHYLFKSYSTKEDMLAAIEHEKELVKNEKVDFLKCSFDVIAKVAKYTIPLN